VIPALSLDPTGLPDDVMGHRSGANSFVGHGCSAAAPPPQSEGAQRRTLLFARHHRSACSNSRCTQRSMRLPPFRRSPASARDEGTLSRQM
jgi:hypothetical protein